MQNIYIFRNFCHNLILSTYRTLASHERIAEYTSTRDPHMSASHRMRRPPFFQVMLNPIAPQIRHLAHFTALIYQCVSPPTSDSKILKCQNNLFHFYIQCPHTVSGKFQMLNKCSLTRTKTLMPKKLASAMNLLGEPIPE